MELIDDYEHINADIEYVLENVLSEQTNCGIGDESIKLKELYNSVLINACTCESSCSHLSTCPHGEAYVWNDKYRELVIRPERESDLIYECSSNCTCKLEDCSNRLVQRGPRKNLQIFLSSQYQSYGVITKQDIPQGAFICEYAGELLTCGEAKLRIQENEKKGNMNYILCLKENHHVDLAGGELKPGSELMTIVDPSKRGNIGRYLNHSCDPNCQIYSVRVDCPIPKVAIFAKRHIKTGEELCFHYNDGKKYSSTSASGKPTLCLCNSKKCQKYLPNLEI
ncbi:probable histone-lysine N-methyltransferase set-23 [Stomoxys calcitrans]|uniref:probable histone-lysine N-methyltransferase set-23 n=1 Tax=Stomoxys calcitrans TaxID=35570 RepID=UPI0027E26631|nr:probable histone-lysine N-methyltransferase set-23 [Stomoxys calcitrans]